MTFLSSPCLVYLCTLEYIVKVELTVDCLRSLVKYVGGYHGLLSGVTVRPGSVEPHSVVECLYACREGLDFGDLETLGSGMKVTPPKTIGYLLHRERRWIPVSNLSIKPKKNTALLSYVQRFTSKTSFLQHTLYFWIYWYSICTTKRPLLTNSYAFKCYLQNRILNPTFILPRKSNLWSKKIFATKFTYLYCRSAFLKLCRQSNLIYYIFI